jgi:hypothetical protein
MHERASKQLGQKKLMWPEGIKCVYVRISDKYQIQITERLVQHGLVTVRYNLINTNYTICIS